MNPQSRAAQNIRLLKKGRRQTFPPKACRPPRASFFFSIRIPCTQRTRTYAAYKNVRHTKNVPHMLYTWKKASQQGRISIRYPSAPDRSSRFLPAFGNDGIFTLPRQSGKVNRFFCKIVFRKSPAVLLAIPFSLCYTRKRLKEKRGRRNATVLCLPVKLTPRFAVVFPV